MKHVLTLLTAQLLIASPASLLAQQPPYDVFPPADPPYYRVRYEASTQPGELVYAVRACSTATRPRNPSCRCDSPTRRRSPAGSTFTECLL